MKIFPKMFLFSLCVTLISIMVLSITITMMLPTYYKQEKNNRLKEDSERLIGQLKKNESEDIENLLHTFNQEYGYTIELVKGEDKYRVMGQAGAKNVLLDREEDNDDSLTEAPTKDVATIETNLLKFITFQQEFVDDKQAHYKLTVRATLQPVNEASQIIVKILPSAVIISIVFASCLSFLFARKFTNPITKLKAETNKMLKMDGVSQYSIGTKDEIFELSESINTLYANLLEVIQQLERELLRKNYSEKEKIEFLRVASHELKTPIQAVSLMLDNIQNKVGKYQDYDLYIPKCQERLVQMGDMVNGLLTSTTFGYASNDKSLQRMLLQDMIDSTVQSYNIIAQAKGVSVVNIVKTNQEVETVIPLLENVLSNILSNAVHYATNKKIVRISFDGEILSIANNCDPLDSEYISSLFQPFYQGRESKEMNQLGTGLGLSIIRMILEELRLSFSFEPQLDGMVFKINLKPILVCEKNV